MNDLDLPFFSRPWFLPSCVFLICASVFLIWTRLEIVNLSYDIQHIKTEMNALEESISSTQIEIQKLSSPQKLKDLAHHRFQMIPLSPHQLIHLTE